MTGRAGDGPEAPEEADDGVPVRAGAPWFLVPVAILVVVLVALAGLELLPIYLGSHPTSTTPTGPGKIATLCTPTTGADCRGHTFALPVTINNILVNATSCDSFASLGSAEVLWMNYSVDMPIYSVVLPAALFQGTYGWSVNAFEIVANQTATGSALWLSPLASGSFSEAIHVPAGDGTYCVGWWEPSSTPATVQWLDDVTITYTPP